MKQLDSRSADTAAGSHAQAGCTAVVAVVKGAELWVANAGDSRAVLCRGGHALALSEDHKPQSESERNRITAAGGFVSDVGGVSRCEVLPDLAPLLASPMQPASAGGCGVAFLSSVLLRLCCHSSHSMQADADCNSSNGGRTSC